MLRGFDSTWAAWLRYFRCWMTAEGCSTSYSWSSLACVRRASLADVPRGPRLGGRQGGRCRPMRAAPPQENLHSLAEPGMRRWQRLALCWSFRATGAAQRKRASCRRGRWSHFNAALFAFYGESRMRYTGARENDGTARGYLAEAGSGGGPAIASGEVADGNGGGPVALAFLARGSGGGPAFMRGSFGFV